MLSERDAPIIAIATAPGKAAVGVVRISGRGLQAYANALCQQTLEPRRAQLALITDANGQAVDQVLALFFPSPHSYTGEDVLELQGHGGPLVMSMLLDRCLAFAEHATTSLPGLRRAMPGEFTQRAFLNQKLDLAQAEAVADLIDAQTQAAVRSAGRSLAGEFSQQVANIQEHLLRLRILVEASLDFPEEDIDFVTQADVSGQIKRITQALNLLCGKAQQGALLRDGMKLVIAGQPNAGKSSLLNALTGQEVAIVTPVAGTTRDVLTQEIAIEGVPVHVVDTAGLREGETLDEVETIGIARAWAQVGNADVVVLLHDLARQQEAVYLRKQNDLTDQVMQRKQASSVVLHVFNKADVAKQSQTLADDRGVFISAKTGQGLQALKQHILQSVGWQASHQEGVFSARARHVQALEKAQLHAEQALACLRQATPALDLLAEELRYAQQHLSELTGAMSADDLLGAIFSSFCIGK